MFNLGFCTDTHTRTQVHNKRGNKVLRSRSRIRTPEQQCEYNDGEEEEEEE